VGLRTRRGHQLTVRKTLLREQPGLAVLQKTENRKQKTENGKLFRTVSSEQQAASSEQ
jgi:hypothetical protein